MPVKTGETIIKVPAIKVPAEIAAKGLTEPEAEKLCADLWKKAVKPVEDAIKGIIKNLADSKSRKWIDPDWGPGAKPGDKDGAHAFYFEKNPNKLPKTPKGYPEPSKCRWDRPAYPMDPKDPHFQETREEWGFEDGPKQVDAWGDPYNFVNTVEAPAEVDDDPDSAPAAVRSDGRGEMFTPYGVLFSGGSGASDVCQGNLGDCWLLGAMAVMASRDDLLENVFWSKMRWAKYGIYVLRFQKDCAWYFVIIDDQIPVFHPSGQPVFAFSADKNELWVPLLEKAYAKLHNAYDGLIGGYIDGALKDMSGLISENLVLRKGHLGFHPSNLEDLQNGPEGQDPRLWKKFDCYLNKWGCMMGCSIQPHPKHRGHLEHTMANGLMYRHAYSLCDVGVVKRAGEEHKLLRVRNPWGFGEWNGAWSDFSPEFAAWENELKDEFNPEKKPKKPKKHVAHAVKEEIDSDVEDDGEKEDEGLTGDEVKASDKDGLFFMEWEDWVRNFTVIFAGVDFPQVWTGLRIMGEWNMDTAGGNTKLKTWMLNPIFRFRVHEHNGLAAGRVFISLSQDDPRLKYGKEYNKHQVPLGFHICPLHDGKCIEVEAEDNIPGSIDQGLWEDKKEMHGGDFKVISDEVRENNGDERQAPYKFHHSVDADVTLKAGDYCIVPSVWYPKKTSNFFISIYCDGLISVENADIIIEEWNGAAEHEVDWGESLTMTKEEVMAMEAFEAARTKLLRRAKQRGVDIKRVLKCFDLDEDGKMNFAEYVEKLCAMGFQKGDLSETDFNIFAGEPEHGSTYILDKDEIKDVFELEAKSGKMLKSGGGDQNKPGAIPMSELAKDATHDPLKHLTGLSQELVSKIANGEGLLEGFQRLNAENKVLVKEVRVLKQEVQRMAGILLLYGRILGCYNQPMPADALNLSAMSGGDDLDAAFAAAAQHGGDEAMAVKPYLGAIHAPSDAPAKPDKKKPKEKLILEWIYGFAGHTFNANIAYNQDGHFTYFNAAVGCVYNHKEGAMKFMQGKNDDDIMSFDTSHDRAWCATGQMGKDPKIVVWDSKDCEALCTLSGYHQRGVPALAFAGAASTRIISIGNDDDHSVALWETKSGDWTDGAMIAEVKGSKSVPMWAIGNPLVTGGDKHILFWSVAGKSLKNEKGATVKGGKKDTQYLCGASTVDGKHIYSGHGGGSLVKWGGSSISEQVKKAHGTKTVKKKEREVGVTSVCVTPSGVVSGGSDGSLKVWDLDLKNNTASFSLRDHEGHKPAPKCFLAPVALYWDDAAGKLAVGTKGAEIWEFNMPGLTDGKRHMQGHFKDELWACATHPNDPMIFVTAGDDKNAMYWDMSNHTCTAVCPMEVKGKKKSTKMMSRSACFSADGKKCVFALGGRLGVSGSKQDPGGFLLMDAETKKTIKAKKDRKKWMMEAKFSPDNKFFLITGTDRVVKIYDENGKFTKVKLKSSNATITHCDYSADGKYIQTNDNGYELLFYQAKDGKQVTKSSSLADTKWYSWTCSLGWPVQGIWPPEADGTDVNGVDRSKSCKLVATSDDFGLVKLFKYPCFAKKGAKYQQGVGHASHVTCVRFNADDTKVITVGGNDKSVFQWRVTNPSEE